jgi:putative transposase
MVEGLERMQEEGDLHFVTFSCYQRRAYLGSAGSRDLFEDALQKAQSRYRFDVVGYVVMPEHVHLLVSEPARESLSVALQGLKLSVARRARTRPFWLPRYYDFNVQTEAKRFEKLNYMHRIGRQAGGLALVQLSLLPDGGAGSGNDQGLVTVLR